MSSTDRTTLVLALRARRPREASRIARRMARAGAWDDVVAATIFLHAREDAGERDEAAARLALPLCARRLAGADAGAEDWEELVRLLFLRGRGDEGLQALWLAAGEGRVDAAAWQRTVLWLYEAGKRADAAVAVRLAVDRFPADAGLWSMAAILALEHAEPEAAAEACLRALELEPAAPGPCLTLAALARLAGDDVRARAALAVARSRGAPAAVVEGWAAHLGL